MKLFAAASLSLLAFTLSARAAATVQSRDFTRCDEGTEGEVILEQEAQPWIGLLLKSCIAITNNDGSDFWMRKTCTAAAISMGAHILVNYASCNHTAMPEQDALPYLDYSVYAGIAGQCAYDAPACGIKPQNVVDFVYNELVAFGATSWPRSGAELRVDVVEPIFTWAGSEGTLSYEQFNSWLRIAGPPARIANNATDSSGKTYYYNHAADNVRP